MIDVSIIIINYKNYKMTVEAVDSINKNSSGFSYEVIVVDNSNDDKEYKMLVNALNNKALVVNAKENLGFGKGNNLGASHATGKFLYFINNDTLLINNAIYELYTFINDHNDVGVVGSNLYTKDKKPNHSFIPFEKNYRNDKKIISLWFIFLSRFRKRFDYNFTNKPKEIKGYVCGASLMIRKDIYDSLEGFDKDIFMYAEESLLCYQVIHKCNYSIYNVPSSKIIHFEGAELDNGVNPSRIKTIVNGNAIYYKKAFNNQMSLKYLKMMYKKYHQISIVKKVLGMDLEESRTFESVYKNKYEEDKEKYDERSR